MSRIPDSGLAARLAKVLQLLDSPHDGEALSAARRTMAILRQHDLAADELAQRLISQAAPAGPPDYRLHLLEAKLSAANAAIQALQADLKHWQDQAWTAASLVAELEDAIRQARAGQTESALSAPIGPETPANQNAPVEAKLPRTQAEKQSAIMALLQNPTTAALPDRELARRLQLSPQTIGNWRRRLGSGADAGTGADGDSPARQRHPINSKPGRQG